MPGHHAIILTDASVAFFPGCVSCAFAKTKCRSLGGMKGTTPLKMIRLFMVSASLCFWILFHLLNIVSNCRFWYGSLCPGRVCLFQVQFWFLLGLPDHSERIRCYWLRSTLDCCRICLRQNSFCSKHLHGVYALLVCTSIQSRNPLDLLPILWFQLMLSQESYLVQRGIQVVCGPSVE